MREQEAERYRGRAGRIQQLANSQVISDHVADEAAATALQALVAERRQADVERQKQQVEQELARAPAAVRELAERNAQLAEERGLEIAEERQC